MGSSWRAASTRGSARPETASTYSPEVHAANRWFAEHVTLYGEPYTLDLDQTRAAIDTHKNTLVTARAGSGKTRVIVAKVAYLVAHGLASLDEIAIFMFNRTAAAEVNARIAEVRVDGIRLAGVCQERLKEWSADHEEREPRKDGRSSGSLETNASNCSGCENASKPCNVASTFHKFALDLAKLAGEHPVIISPADHDALIQNLLNDSLNRLHLKLSRPERQEMLSIANNFITRAGQYYPGYAGLKRLEQKVIHYCTQHSRPDQAKAVRFHRVSFAVYRAYLSALRAPQIDFNLLLNFATELLLAPSCPATLRARISPLKYILIDEYQDFSYLFFALIQALRQLAPAAHLFCVGDDWQAINRFAGSNVDYFINFATYFPEDVINIPLATNYRSACRIVERTNRYMLTHYDPAAIPAIPFSSEAGKISVVNPDKLRFRADDALEDALHDGRFLLALHQASRLPLSKIPPGAPRLLKATYQILCRHPHASIMLLHRHNFTSFDGITLEVFNNALRTIVINEQIMTPTAFSAQVRGMTMHKSKGLEADIVILLELNAAIVQGMHPHATIFELFGDTRATEVADQQRLIYVALTRAKHHLYLASTDKDIIA